MAWFFKFDQCLILVLIKQILNSLSTKFLSAQNILYPQVQNHYFWSIETSFCISFLMKHSQQEFCVLLLHISFKLYNAIKFLANALYLAQNSTVLELIKKQQQSLHCGKLTNTKVQKYRQFYPLEQPVTIWNYFHIIPVL